MLCFYSLEEDVDEALISFIETIDSYMETGLCFAAAMGKYMLELCDEEKALPCFTKALEQGHNTDEIPDYVKKLIKKEKVIKSCPFYKKKYVITGSLAGMERDVARSLIEKFGGSTSDKPINSMDVLVVGYLEWSKYHDGKPTRKILKAEELKKEGKKIKIIGEDKFMKQLSAVAKKILDSEDYENYFSESDAYWNTVHS